MGERAIRAVISHQTAASPSPTADSHSSSAATAQWPSVARHARWAAPRSKVWRWQLGQGRTSQLVGGRHCSGSHLKQRGRLHLDIGGVGQCRTTDAGASNTPGTRAFSRDMSSALKAQVARKDLLVAQIGGDSLDLERLLDPLLSAWRQIVAPPRRPAR